MSVETSDAAASTSPLPNRADLSRLSLNTATIKGASLAEAIEVALATGIPALGLWRDRVQEIGVAAARTMMDDAGLRTSSLCRGGFLTAARESDQAEALADNRLAIDEAHTLGTSELIMVVGGLEPGDVDLVGARSRVADRIADLVPYAEAAGVRLVLEALHPMYCADRAVLSTIGQALDLCSPHPSHVAGVVVDTFHVWWDPDLEHQIARAGNENRLASYQVCDWLLPIASDPLLSRGYMGDGFVDFERIGRWVRETGYVGDIEVEIFNADIWADDPLKVAETVARRFVDVVLPAADESTDPAGTEGAAQ